MDWILHPVEIRVLGCLLEKEAATPEYYPLTLNSLVLACNQKSNRDPVVEYDETSVLHTLDGLREKGLVLRVDQAGSRVPKFRHQLLSRFPLNEREVALLCTLFLRGPQTSGELRSRSERLYPFRDLAQVEETIHDLATRLEEPLLQTLPRQPGHKEVRHAHLFSGEPVVSTPLSQDRHEAAPASENPALNPAKPSPPTPTWGTVAADLTALRERIAVLELAVQDLQSRLPTRDSAS